MNTSVIQINRTWTKVIDESIPSWLLHNNGPNPVYLSVMDKDEPDESEIGLKLQTGKEIQKTENISGDVWLRSLNEPSTIVIIS